MKLDRRRFVRNAGSGAVASLLTAQSTSTWAAAILGQTPEQPSPDIAHDPLRPECHLMPPHNWMNDPNGPIWWKGKYHLFYQLNPKAAVWGDMHWGHAVSTDMVHWHHQPIALAPTPGGADSEGCFSGSAVVLNGVPTFIYTGVQNAPPALVTLRDGNDKLRETQMIATAEDDNLLRWKKVETPVIPSPPEGMVVTGFRDPCPWHEADGWYLGVGSGERGKGGCVLLYRSQDFQHWEYLHKLSEGKPNGKVAANPCDSGEMWECPDFFAVSGKHCMFYSTEDKVIWATGDYDEKAHVFTPRRQGLLDHGSYYAPKSFLAPGGRRVLWGWIRETRPEADFAAAGWSGAMALPRVLSIDAQGQLEIRPAAEVEKLRGPIRTLNLTSAAPYRLRLATLRHEFSLPILPSGTTSARLTIGGRSVWELTVDGNAKSVQCGAIKFGLPSPLSSHSALRMILDGSVIESFIGATEALTSRVYEIKPGATLLEITVSGGKPVELSHWPLNSISNDRLTT